jgi:hypothetical protein
MEQQANNYNSTSASSSFVRPVSSGSVGSGFGMRNHPTRGGRRMHNGVDIGVRTGTPVMSASGGRVTRVANDPDGYGLWIEVNHGQHSTRYAHLSRQNVGVGDIITPGQVIGLSGNTGSSTGPHLHFEVRDSRGRPLDPSPFLSGASIIGSSNPNSPDSPYNHSPEIVTPPTNPIQSMATALANFIRGSSSSSAISAPARNIEAQVPIIQGVPGKENRATPIVKGAPDRVRTSSSSQKENKPSTAPLNVISPVMSIYAYSMYWGVGD